MQPVHGAAAAEWRSLKYGEVYLREYDSPGWGRAGAGAWLRFLNHERLHQALGYRTPRQVYVVGRTNEAAGAAD